VFSSDRLKHDPNGRNLLGSQKRANNRNCTGSRNDAP
jgi:hypothetical protein